MRYLHTSTICETDHNVRKRGCGGSFRFSGNDGFMNHDFLAWFFSVPDDKRFSREIFEVCSSIPFIESVDYGKREEDQMMGS